MTYLIEQLINGICQGAIYALFAIGYTIIVGVVGLVTSTFGEVIMIGAFAALFTATLSGGHILLTILFSFAASGLVGIDVGGATLMGNVLGCGIGGVAGMLYALYYGSLSASMGGMATMKAFSSSVLGGLVDIQASAIGGLLIGISENYGIALFSSSLRDMIAFVFLIIVLIFFPKGLRIKIGRKAK